MIYLLKHTVVTILICLGLGFGAALVGQAEEPSQRVRWRASAQVFLRGAALASAQQIEQSGSGDTLVLDRRNHRICVFDEYGQFVRQIGRIGQRAGEFFVPVSFSAAQDGRVVVLDGNNWRLQVLKNSGEPVGLFPMSPKSAGLLARKGNEVLLNYPSEGTLISVYDHRGERRGGFGELITEAEAFAGFSVSRQDSEAFSRVLLKAARSSQLFSVFRYAPIVRKYTGQGQLLWQRRLEDPAVRTKVEAAWRQPLQLNNEKMDGRTLAVIFRSAAFDEAKGLLYVLLDDSGRPLILVLREETGEHVANIVFDPVMGSPQAIGVVRGQLIVAGHRAVHRLVLKEGLTEDRVD